MPKLEDIARNRVFGVLAAYVVIGLTALEGLDVLQEALGFPSVVLTVAAVVTLAGLPVAVGWAWYADRRDRAAEAGAGGERDAESASATDEARRTRAWKVAGYGVVGAVVVLAGGWWYSSGRGEDSGPLDPGKVAVMPFGTGGAHPDLGWLEQGAMDLLAAKLTGDFGPRAVDPRAVLSRLGEIEGGVSEEAALAGARRLGAGFVLTGSVVGSPGRFTLSAVLRETERGEERSRGSVQASVDSLAPAVDRLLISLLSLEAGEAEHRLASLTSTDPAAVRGYLAGQSLYRQGRYESAVEAFDRALDLDSTFALAAIGLTSAANMTLEPEYSSRAGRGTRLALAARENLSAIDRRFLELWVGGTEPATYTERRRVRERAVQEMPDRPELWYRLGDLYFHWGNLFGVSDRWDRAEAAFNRAVALDSLHYVSIQHLGWIALARGDTAAARRYVELQLERVEGSPSLPLRLDSLVVAGDTAGLRRLNEEVLREGSGLGLNALVLGAHAAGWEWTDARAAGRAIRRLLETATSSADRLDALSLAHDFALNAGRPAEASRLLDRAVAEGGDRIPILRQRVYDALYWDGDTASAHAAVETLETELDAGALDGFDEADARCAVLQWSGWQGTPRPDHRRSLASWRNGPERSEGARLWADLCGALYDAVLAWRVDPPGAVTPIATLDSILALGPANVLRDPANVMLARIHGDRGDYGRALAVADRIPNDASPDDYWSALKFEIARWAERAGDYETARQAYADWLEMRYDPEPGVQAMVDEVRRRLERLAGEAS